MKFKAPAILLALSTMFFGGLPAGAALVDFEGAWRNRDDDTKGITRLVVRRRGPGLELRVFGRCRPQDCDWGWQRATPYAGRPSDEMRFKARSLTAVYTSDVHEKTLVVRLGRRGKSLRVDVFTRFSVPGRGSNYHATYRFVRDARGADAAPESDDRPGRAPDLAIRGFRHRPTGACRAGKRVLEFRVTVENRGGAATPALGRRKMIRVFDRHNVDWSGSAALPALAPGAKKTVSVYVAYLRNNPAHMTDWAPHPFQIVLDPNDLVRESDEANNVSVPIQVEAPPACR